MLLLPEDYPCEEFEDASHLLEGSESLREQAVQQGYVYFKGLVPDSAVRTVRAFVRERCAEFGWVKPNKKNPPTMLAQRGAKLTGRGWDDPTWVQFQLEVINHPEFRALALHENLTSALDTVCGEPMVLATAHHCWLKLPGSPEHTTRPHQDTFYLPDCPRMWTVWIPLIDTPLDVGPLGVIPRSHVEGDWHHIDAMTGIDVAKDVGWVTGFVNPGDIVMFGASTVHCAWSNVSPTETRLSLDVRYEPADVKGASILRPQLG